MISNRDISHLLSDTAKLMELHGKNGFKIRSIQNAAFSIGRLDTVLAEISEEEIGNIKGIGKSLSQKIVEIIATGTHAELEELVSITPAGVIEMMRIKGIGAKKVAVLWKELEVESLGELLYACNENRLVELKGFGTKTQDQIKKAIEFKLSNQGFFHYASLEEIAEEMQSAISKLKGVVKIALSGSMRRKCEVVEQIDFVVASDNFDEVKKQISELKVFSLFKISTNNDEWLFNSEDNIKVQIHRSSPSEFALKLLLTTGSTEHLEQLNQIDASILTSKENFDNEHAIFSRYGLTFIEPELREGRGECELAREDKLPKLIQLSDLKGCLHNHSTYSDGGNTLREMADACKESGYQYFGICDHSKSAFYANGLSEERVLLQQKEIEEINKQLAPFVVFKGIESDILPDGSLDYRNEILETFDFVVASVHSVLKMSEEKATARILKAISNPYTTILGHPTGRLLLAREGYPIDHKTIIDACARHNVVIELNAHPYRLDLDWRWIKYAVDCGVMISINPDAHQVSGIHDMHFGICVARKGMLTINRTFNALSVDDIKEWFLNKKQKAVQGATSNA